MGNNASSPKASGVPGHESGTHNAANSGGRPIQYHQQLQQQHLQQQQQQQQQPQQQQQQQHPQQHQQRNARNPVLVHNQRVAAAPPEPSMAHAHGSTTSSSSRSIPARPYGSAAEAAEAAVAASASPSRTPAKSRNTPPPPSKPVAVPQASGATTPAAAAGTTTTATTATAPTTTATHTAAASGAGFPADLDVEPPLSPYADSMDIPILAHNSMQELSYMTRPPRLPLPIEEEVHTPGSPIIAPREDGDSIEDIEALDGSGSGSGSGSGVGGDGDGDGITHRSSTLSSATVDEDDMEELRVDKTRPTVPTRLEWLRGGEKVYVTGTIFQWNRKQRMHPVEGRPGVFATTINVLPGTHHIRFLVDNKMETSRDLPTTVDFGNNLVNYIEVYPPSTPPQAAPAAPGTGNPQAQPQPLSAAERKQAQQTLEAHQQQQQQEKHQQQQQQQQQQLQAPPPNKPLRASSSLELTTRPPKWKSVPPPSAFSHELPTYLVDYDQPDDSPDFHTAAVATEILPMPPSLPGFLGKPILNAATLIKDDNSVLNMPNYTILNHLATSSIKNNILAVSATTRYKDKFVTIIIYKPTGGDDKH
ncbi:5-AMP-activated protein kinase, beta subunit, interaction domain protein [Niveomyces insectorum RCEF 264]|uniref:5-AMP-activated protein kinase, beta subunit, interaction domain protein n=1 Tax=Niveomyces insectorum RCEF 264 TaxID=1081102 RepID=A0A167X718_9HYPO|nr:5-AMP-activated protein kinase, beta subunit, interaction domain protein [Niveomyces insectorum RCEF 264]